MQYADGFAPRMWLGTDFRSIPTRSIRLHFPLRFGLKPFYFIMMFSTVAVPPLMVREPFMTVIPVFDEKSQ